jgi:phosphoglycerate kinase
MNLPKVSDLDVAGKKVLLRLDLDTEPDPNDLRIKASEETLDYLKNKGAEIIILAHRGRPEGKIDKQSLASQSPGESLSLKPFQPIFDKWGAKVEENLRFDPGEEANDPEFAKKLASLGEVYINEAFASSHRSHASIVGLPKLLPHAAGFRFIKEVENLSKVLENPKRPLVFVISGIKKDKLDYVKAFESMADRILVGGRLPELLGDEALESIRLQKGKVLIGNLTMDKEDITLNSIEVFEKVIKTSGTIVVSGPLGKFEDEGHRMGTEKIFKAVVRSSAYKVAGGGDTERAIALSGVEGFDWISVGGGAMLEFLVHKTLPGIEALTLQSV